MAGSWNRVTFEVHVGKDPVLRTTKGANPKSVLNFGGACHSSRDKERQPLWIGARVWQKLAETVSGQIAKGRKLFIQGRIPVLPAPHKYSVRNGAEVYLSGDAKAVADKVFDLLRANSDRVSDNAQVRQLITNLMSSQIVVDVDSLRYGDDKYQTDATAETASTDGIDIDLPEPDDDIPF
jgi:single-stranded DNA-binding protein